MAVKTETQKKDSAFQPNDLNGYIRAVPISVSLAIVALLVFVAGLFAWGAMANLNVTVDGVAVVRGDEAALYLPSAKSAGVRLGDEVRLGGAVARVDGLTRDAVPAAEALDAGERALAGFSESEEVAQLRLAASLPEGSYFAQVILEQIRPIQYLFGRGRTRAARQQ